jgi:RimJ/RimL family protein N-acetyltransferase
MGSRSRVALLDTGVFINAARSTVEFAFDTLGVHRLEGRSAVANGRGNGALAKVEAITEGVLRQQDKAVWGSIIQ